MLENFKKALHDKFTQDHPHQSCYVYDFTGEYFGLDGLEGEEVIRLIFDDLIKEGFMIYRANMFFADMIDYFPIQG
jgi:hypothetical protein